MGGVGGWSGCLKDLVVARVQHTRNKGGGWVGWGCHVQALLRVKHPTNAPKMAKTQGLEFAEASSRDAEFDML